MSDRAFHTALHEAWIDSAEGWTAARNWAATRPGHDESVRFDERRKSALGRADLAMLHPCQEPGCEAEATHELVAGDWGPYVMLNYNHNPTHCEAHAQAEATRRNRG